MTPQESLARIYGMLTQVQEEDYLYLCWNPNKGYCGIMRMAFTVGLFYNISEDQMVYEGRYCYQTMAEAVQALVEWDGKGDAPGDWIKHKGLKEYSHPDSKDPFAIKPH